MSLYDDLGQALTEGRAVADLLMQDFGIFRSPLGFSGVNADGRELPTFKDEFSTRCKITGVTRQRLDPSSVQVEVGGVKRPYIAAGLAIPIGSPLVAFGWVFEVLSTGPYSDPRIVGRKYLVHNDPASSLVTARRLDIVEYDDAHSH